MKESVTITNVSDDEEVKYVQVIPNETEFLEWQRKRICENCRIVKRKGVVRVVCTNPRHKQRQG